MSISGRRHDPAFQIRTIGVQWLHEEEGNDDDIQSKDDDARVAKVEIASRIFRNYYCVSMVNEVLAI